jgi:Cys-Gly metallodipeptidase DUG1
MYYFFIFSKVDQCKEAFLARLSEAVAIQSVSAEPERRPDVFRMISWAQNVPHLFFYH